MTGLSVSMVVDVIQLCHRQRSNHNQACHGMSNPAAIDVFYKRLDVLIAAARRMQTHGIVDPLLDEICDALHQAIRFWADDGFFDLLCRCFDSDPFVRTPSIDSKEERAIIRR
jgi:hypothetical protein